MTDPAEHERYRISRISAEFLDSGVELAFRQACHGQVVRDLRFTLAIMIVVSMLLGVSDYLILGPSQPFYNLLSGRIGLILCALLVMIGARRFWRSLMDGVTPSVVEIVGITLFLGMTLLRPNEPGWHAMSLMVILIGMYVFVPNRFLIVLGLSLVTTVLFLFLLDGHFQLAAREFFLLCVMLFGVNIVGARASYRLSWRVRDAYRSGLRQSALQAALQQERELRIALQTERDQLARSDVLTGTVNQRHFQRMLDQALNTGTSDAMPHLPISLLVLEVDYFKQLVDTYGKQHAQTILSHLVKQCQHALRQSDDTLARLGEASFAVMQLECDSASARETAERLRSGLQRIPLRLPDAAVYVSASVGVAQWLPGETAESLLRRADDAMLQARASGGNRVVLAGMPLETKRGGAQNPPPVAALPSDDTSERT